MKNVASFLKECFSVAKLNSNNYSVWKFKTGILVMKKVLFNHLTNDLPSQQLTNVQRKIITQGGNY